MGHLEPKLLRFQGLIWRIIHFCTSNIIEVIAQNVKNCNFRKMEICKKKSRQNADVKIAMDGDGKSSVKSLKIAIIEF